MPIVILLFVQTKNFCLNRTTNERFGGKKYKQPVRTDSDDNSDSESGLSTTTSIIAEELILEFGKPEEFNNKNLVYCLNIKAMFCSNKIPDQ